jgi:hypothetical protein
MATKKVAQAKQQASRDATDVLIDSIMERHEKRQIESHVALRLERIEMLEWMNRTPGERAAEIRRLASEIDELDLSSCRLQGLS